MTQTFAEILILFPSTLTTGYLMFVPAVLQRTTNELDEATFGRFVPLLLRKATSSVYAVVSSSITFVAMIPYFRATRRAEPADPTRRWARRADASWPLVVGHGVASEAEKTAFASLD